MPNTFPSATLIGLYPAVVMDQMKALPVPGAGESYLVLKTGGNFSESGIHAGIQFVAPLMVALARANFSMEKSAALATLVTQMVADIESGASAAVYMNLVPMILKLASAK